MAENKNLNHISKEKFSFIHDGERISDKKFDDKPIGSFKDAWIRFRKNKASVVASIIILSIVLFAFLAPMFITNHDGKFMCTNYAKLPGRIASLQPYGIFDGGVEREPSDSAFLKLVAMGAGAESYDGHTVTIGEAMTSDYQPILKEGETFTRELPGKKFATYHPSRIDASSTVISSRLNCRIFWTGRKRLVCRFCILWWKTTNGTLTPTMPTTGIRLRLAALCLST